MKSTIKNYDELPLYLNANDISNLLGISKSTAYELMSNNEFPSIRLGGRVLVERDKFINWLDKKAEK
jgi:excisionase family DNA binding protein